MKEILNKKILQVQVDRGCQEYLKFFTNEGEIYYHGYGDCCSETYFSELMGIDSILNKEIIDIEELNLGEGEGTRQESDSIYGYKLKAKDSHGVCLILFRNSSNGYYGGSCELCDKPKDEEKWIDIKDSWSSDD